MVLPLRQLVALAATVLLVACGSPPVPPSASAAARPEPVPTVVASRLTQSQPSAGALALAERGCEGTSPVNRLPCALRWAAHVDAGRPAALCIDLPTGRWNVQFPTPTHHAASGDTCADGVSLVMQTVGD